MKIAIVTANLGSFDQPVVHAKQDIPADFYHFTDENFKPRSKAMTPRLQARIAKTHMWQFAPGYDYYLWVDTSCRLARPDSIKWFLEQLADADIAVFKHNRRNTVQEEADYLRERIGLESSGKKQKYVLPRYENEDIDGQLAAVDPSGPLYASTAFIMKNSPAVRRAMKDWWYHISRYHSIDQLSLPHVISKLEVNVIAEDYLKCQYLQYVRGRV